MHTTIRRYKMDPNTVEELTRRVTEEFVPIVSQIRGFIGYYVVDGGDGNIASISVFKDRAGAEESTRRAAEWVKARLASLLPTSPDVLAGEVVVRHEGARAPA